MHVIVNSRKEKGEQLKKWVLEDIFPRGLKDKIRELQKKHRQVIEKKEAALALISDDFYESQNQMAKSQREMFKLMQDTADLQAAVETLKRCVVPHLGDTGKDNRMTIIQKNN